MKKDLLPKFIESLQAILIPYNLLINGEQIRLMRDSDYISKVKDIYIKSSAIVVEEYMPEFNKIGFLTKNHIDGLVSDVFYQFFKENV